MATAVVISAASYVRPGVVKQSWSATVSGFSNTLNAPYITDKTVEIRGPTGGTSNVVIEGSNDAPTGTFFTLTDNQGNLLDMTTGGIRLISESPLYIRARFNTVTSGKTLVATIVGVGELR